MLPGFFCESTMTTKEFHTLREAAQLLNASPPTIRSWVRQGLLPRPVAIGRKRLFSTSQLFLALEDLRGGKIAEPMSDDAVRAASRRPRAARRPAPVGRPLG